MAMPQFSRSDHLGRAFSTEDLLRAAPVIVVLLRGFF